VKCKHCGKYFSSERAMDNHSCPGLRKEQDKQLKESNKFHKS